MTNLVFDSEAKQNSEAITSYLWDYLRKSGASGFYVLLQGDRVSNTNAMLVYYLCVKIFNEIQDNNVEVLQNLRKIIKNKNFMPKEPQEICNYLLTTTYLPERDYAQCRKEATINLKPKWVAIDCP
jgi:NAD+ synthase (glutamine-hydrolysing)